MRLKEEASAASAVAAAAATAAQAEQRTQCEKAIAQERAQAAARLVEAEERHDAALQQTEQAARRRVEVLQAAHLTAMVDSEREAADCQARNPAGHFNVLEFSKRREGPRIKALLLVSMLMKQGVHVHSNSVRPIAIGTHR